MIYDINKMCDRCLRMLSESEDMFGFRIVDSQGLERTFKGHQFCIQEIAETLNQLYGKKGDDE